MTDSFIEPTLVKAGTVIEYNGPPGPHLDALNDEAADALRTYYRENPHASINPVDSLATTMEPVEMRVVSQPTPQELAGFGNLAQATKVRGPTEGGQIADDMFRIHGAAAPGGVVVADPPGVGSNAPSVEGTAPKPDVEVPANIRAEDPALGDPTKPGEKGAELKAVADKANADSTAQGPAPSSAPKLEVK